MKYPDKLRQEGRKEGILETAKNLIKQGFSLDIITHFFQVSSTQHAKVVPAGKIIFCMESLQSNYFRHDID